MSENDRHTIRIFLAGDVMTGRGIDQILPHPANPLLHEPYVDSALTYVELAEKAHGPIPRGMPFDYIWGEALTELKHREPDIRLVNLETAITTSESYVPKGINYRMSPDNVRCLTAAQIDCCSLANNHVLDWGIEGLMETVRTLDKARIMSVGAGRDIWQARQPAIFDLPGKGRVLVFAFGCASSGIGRDWGATEMKAGVNLLPDLAPATTRRLADDVAAVKKPSDVVVASIHWGGNWGFEIDTDEVAFAHRLVDEAEVDLVHGHSSHHAKGIEIYHGKLILYGCGDFLNDYEGISGHEAYRDDLPLMYFADMDPSDGVLVDLTMVPLRLGHFRLSRAGRRDVEQVRGILTRACARFDTAIVLREDHTLGLAL